MAHILVVGAEASIAQRRLRDALVDRMRRDGHDAVAWNRPPGGAARSIHEADAVVALLDGIPAEAATAIALAHASDKPCLGLATRGQAAPLFTELTRLVEADAEEGWWTALPSFYEHIRPFAGRLVRDRIPQLVKDAGHDVQFRSLGTQERPRFLKQKIATEAKELLGADLANEKEEVADVLEALEAFILARGFDRDDLRRIKDHKKKQRGGFERAFVVEASSRAGDPPAPDAPASMPDTATRASSPTTPTPGSPSPAVAATTRASPPTQPRTDASPSGPRATRPSVGAPAEAAGTGFGVAQRAAQAGPPGQQPAAPGHGSPAVDNIANDGMGFDDNAPDADQDEARHRDAQVDDVGRGRDVRATFFEI